MLWVEHEPIDAASGGGIRPVVVCAVVVCAVALGQAQHKAATGAANDEPCDDTNGNVQPIRPFYASI